jgi:hypothetical protein
MKRDMELVKALLLSLEENDAIGEIERYTAEQVEYHSALLAEAGLITHETFRDAHRSAAALVRTRMTWVGHEFLDATRNRSIWERAKKITL